MRLMQEKGSLFVLAALFFVLLTKSYIKLYNNKLERMLDELKNANRRLLINMISIWKSICIVRYGLNF